MRIGVFICQAGIAGAEAVNLEAVSLYASNLPHVEIVEVLGLLPKLDPDEVAKRIAESRLDRLVIAGDSPGFFKPAFTRAMSLAGGQARRSAPGFVPPVRGRRRQFHRESQGDRGVCRLRRALQPCRSARRDEDASGDARHRRRHSRHPSRPRDRRRRQEGLPRRAHGDDRWPHGDVRQDLPDTRLRRVHPDAEDGRGRPARQHRPDDLLGGGVDRRLAGSVQGDGPAQRPPSGRGLVRGLQPVRRRVPGERPQ